MNYRFNTPPNWPSPPDGWQPDPSWRPDPRWPAPPPGWQLWIPDPFAEPESAKPPAQVSLTGQAWLVVLGAGGLGAVSSGVSGAVVLVGLALVVIGGVAWAQRGSAWSGLRRGRPAGTVAGIGLVACLVGGALAPEASSGSKTEVEVTAQEPSASATPSSTAPSPSPSLNATEEALVQAAPSSALGVLATLKVGGHAEADSYRRAAFGAGWADVDGNDCDQRNDVLRRDLSRQRLKAGTGGCKVASGVLRDPYSGRAIRYSPGSVVVDHAVSPAAAWVSGAHGWSSAQRRRFANDQLNLVAVGAAGARAKGTSDAAAWLPATASGRCAYVARQVAVKAKYRLLVQPAERDAMVRALDACPGRRPAVGSVIPLGGAPVAKPKPKPAPVQRVAAPEPQAPSMGTVHPGSFCSTRGVLGRTVKGTLMACTTTATDSRLRWRAA